MNKDNNNSSKIETLNERAISLVNDCDDLRFTLFLEGKPHADGWNPYHSALMIKDRRSGEYKNIYSSAEGEVVSELSTEDLSALVRFLKKSLEDRNQSHEFSSETQDFALGIQGEEDIFSVSVSIDLCNYSSEKLETGYGDSALSLSFGTTAEEISRFIADIDNWIKQSN